MKKKSLVIFTWTGTRWNSDVWKFKNYSYLRAGINNLTSGCSLVWKHKDSKDICIVHFESSTKFQIERTVPRRLWVDFPPPQAHQYLLNFPMRCDRKKRWCIDKTSDDLCKEGGGPKSVITFMQRQHIPPIKAIILSIVNPITSFPHAHFDVCIWVKQFILVCVATRTGSSSSMVESVAISGNYPPPPCPLGENCRK